MGLKSYMLFLVAYLSVVNKMDSAPLLGATDGFCNGEDTLKYKTGSTYTYKYSTKTDLWISDVSEESRSTAELTANVLIISTSPCSYLLRVDNPVLSGESVANTDVSALTLETAFKMSPRGELHSELSFLEQDSAWSRNIKRGILSALQSKSVNNLREHEDGQSAVVYETDVLGRCRTTYTVKKSDATSITLKKKKSLHGCTLNGNHKSSAIQYVPYRNMPVSFVFKLTFANLRS